ncbi:MAG: YvcK family protein [Chloroflexi bacterium]|nr:YvcK family protein [Chloroflexota bacterium]
MGLAWIYRNIDFPTGVTDLVQTLTLQFIPHPYREIVIGLPGLLLVVYAAYRLSRSLLAALLPEEPTGPRRSLVDRIYAHRYGKRGPRIVAVGGGTGLSTMLRGLKKYSGNITAILTVGDDGGSTGRLRRDMGILPPGDFRNCIVALADSEPLVRELFQYRFPAGSGQGLEGHSFGNLFIVAMLGVTGDFEKAVAETSRVLAVRGLVLPSTMADVTLCADMQDGSVIVGESNIVAARKGIKRIFLQPERPAGYPEALRAILDADLIILGPGSLYTSILPNLLVEDVARAIRLSTATKVYVCNVATQRGETDHFTVADHVNALVDHVGAGFFDVVLVNDNFQSIERIKPEWQVHPVGQGETARTLHGAQVVLADVVNVDNPLRHDPDKLAGRLLRLWQERASGAAWAARSQPPPLATARPAPPEPVADARVPR